MLLNILTGLPPEWLEVETDDGVAVADAKGNWYKVPNNWVVRIDGCDEPSGFVCEQRRFSIYINNGIIAMIFLQISLELFLLDRKSFWTN